jgi:hypothetical protein
MGVQMLGQPHEIVRVIALLAKALKLKSDSLCFCGNGKAFNQCCGSVDTSRIIFLEKEIERAKAYGVAHDWSISTIPGGIWKPFEISALERLTCLYPHCQENPVNCHLIPENVLRSNYGGHCKEYRLKDGSIIGHFVKTGINLAGCLPVFCSRHDNDLFQAIDKLPTGELSKEQCFMFAFKVIAFSLRKTQFLLGIDSQVEIAKPFLMSANPRVQAGNHTINVNHFAEQYARFKALNSFWHQAIELYCSQSLDSLVSIHRSIPCSKPLFAAGVVNPSHDLKGQRINRTGTAIAIACTAYTKDGQLHIVLTCVNETSGHLYRKFLNQMKSAAEGVVLTAMNNLLTSSPMNVFLLPESFDGAQNDLWKMESSRQCLAQALKPAGPIFDLKNQNYAVKFI